MIGISYPDPEMVEVTFQLLKVPWEWYNPLHIYDVVIARKKDIDIVDSHVIDLSEKDYFAEIAKLLNEGVAHCHEPIVEIIIDELRQKLINHTLLVEIPPVPWGYTYISALTHDVDISTVRERRWVSVGNAFCQCIRKGEVKAAFQIICAKCGIGIDPWDCFEEWMKLETDLGVRSTWFFLPFKGKGGEGAPDIRSGYYDLNPELINKFIDGGWEVGVHGIDNWRDNRSAKEELRQVSEIVDTPVGTRIHWLLFNSDTWRRLDEAGYVYDSTFGYNDDVGFRAGTMQAYKPQGCNQLLELPLIIQDGALFGGKTWNSSDGGGRGSRLALSEDEAMSSCEKITAYAKKYGGIVTILWHQVSIAQPKMWGGLYRSLVEKMLSDKSWVTTAINAVEWFVIRSDAVIMTESTPEGIKIQTSGIPSLSRLPELRIRIHANAKNLGEINGDYIEGEGYIDLRCSSREILVKLHESTTD